MGKGAKKTERRKDLLALVVLLLLSFALRLPAAGARERLNDPDSYYYLRQAQRGLAESWTLADWRDCDRYSDPLIGTFNVVKGGGPTPQFHPMVLSLLYRALSWTGVGLEQLAYWLGPCIAGLAAIPVYFFLKKRAGRWGAAAGAGLLLLAPIYLARTWPGSFDTDLLLATLPIAAIALMAESVQAETLKKQIFYGAGGALAMVLLSFTWSTYWAYFYGAMLLGLVAVLFCLPFHRGLWPLRGYGVWLLLTWAAVGLFQGGNIRFLLSVVIPAQKLGIPTGVSHPGIWPSASLFVSEWKKLSFFAEAGTMLTANSNTYLGLVGGGLALLAAAAGAVLLIVSLIRQLFKKSSLLPRLSGGALAVTGAVLLPWAAITMAVMIKNGYRFAYMALLPLALLAGIGLGAACECALQRRFLPELLFILAAAAAFSSLLVFGWIPAALGAACFLGLYFFSVSGKRGARRVLALGLSAAMLLPCAANACAAGGTNAPYADETEEALMDWVRDNTEKDAILASWWDYGYYDQYEAQRKTIGDGGEFDGWFFTQLAGAMMDDDAASSAKRLRALSGDESRPLYLVLTPGVIDRISVIAYYGLWNSETGETEAPDTLQAEDYTITRLYAGITGGQSAFTLVCSMADPARGGAKLLVYRVND